MTSIPRKQPDSGATPPRSQPGYVESTRRTIPTSQPAYTAFFEGYRGYLHLVQGIPHIGYGHVVGPRGWRPPDHDVTMHNEWIPEPLARMILQYDLEQAVLRLQDILGPEVWRSLDDEQKHRALPANAVARGEYRFPPHQEVGLASPRQIVLMDWCINTGGGSMPHFVEAVKVACGPSGCREDWKQAAGELLYKAYGAADERSEYYKTRPERAELNAAVIASGEWPE